jgi:hypothetical protein
MILGSRAYDCGVGHAKFLDYLEEEVCPTQLRIEKSDRDIGAGDRDDQAGETCTCADVTQRRTGRNERGEYATVQQVPIPQPPNLTRSKKASFHTNAGEKCRVALHVVELFTEHHVRLWWCGRNACTRPRFT